ncbi:hypothetical protein GQ473_07230 [archaeon]|nr:hypothetical protein [archaeon]
MIFITTLMLMITANILLVILSVGIISQHTHINETITKEQTTSDIPTLIDNYIQKQPITNITHDEFLKNIEELKNKRHNSQIYT